MALLLRAEHLRALLTPADLIPLMERALAEFSNGGVIQPVRSVVAVEEHHGFLALMPAYARAEGALGLKAVTYYPANAPRGVPTHMATVLLLDVATGALLAILDGGIITEMRTAAVSAAATKHLARSGASTLALLGAGVQARSHLEALLVVLTPNDIRVWNRTRPRADTLAHEAGEEFGVAIRVTDTAKEAVEGADVVCTVTSSETPVLHGAWLRLGAHINAVGAPRPTWRELDSDAVTRARVFVDSRAGAAVEAGDLIIPLREGAVGDGHIVAEIGEVFAGKHPGRTGPEQITLFKSLGMAVEDVTAADFAYRKAREQKLGEEISLA